MEVHMARPAIAALCAAATLSFTVPTRPAQAYGDAPWCAVINLGTGDVVWECEYRTAEECAPHVLAGNRGFCNVNPYGSSWSVSGPVVPHRHAHRRRPRS
jgi:hypothetical protein